ncbi:MAG: hypothetical protein ACYS9X_10735, partial [Planctomycetota bacterium]
MVAVRPVARAVFAAWLLFCAPRAARSENRVRNGSFEGSLLYWHNIKPEHDRLVRGDAAVGEYSLRIGKSWVMSAPFVCERGQPFTVSFFVKGEREGEVRVQLPPSAREVGQRAKRIWNREGSRSARIGTAWKRVSFTAEADVPPTGFWPHPHYTVLIARGNLLERGATVRLVGHASNTGDAAREVTLRWQLMDYEGERSAGASVDRRVVIPAGGTMSETVSMKLAATGCVLARVRALAGGRELDRSDLPLTSLPYDFGPGRPDPRERFGGSFFNAGSARLGRPIGFAWTRWFPHTKWQDHQPDGPDSWHWFDEELDILEGLGVSTHIVLYGWPKWIMDKKHPLPRDMRWRADDPRWEDLAVETAWDRYIKRTVARYKGRSVVYEIENEPELDRWDKHRDEYAKFTIRTARQIKAVDPAARVMVDNVYGIPSGLNRHLLKLGGARHIDIISWHDYHEGWLADATAIRRMRAALDGLGGEHIEIWFNEGWAYTNTAVDEPLACTRHTSSASTNAMVASVAEMTVTGQEKTIIFHTGYAQHGMSFWDYSGPGTMLWDWYSYPLPLAAAWNTLTQHIGLSERVAFVRPKGANFCVFEDLRNRRGVMVAYADRESKADVTVDLPFADLVAEDAMGNAAPLGGRTLTLSKTGRPVFLYDAGGTSGKAFAEKLEPLDRRNASFVSEGGGAFGLPSVWEGKGKLSQEGNPALAG